MMSQPHQYNSYFWSPWNNSSEICDLLNKLEGFDTAIQLADNDHFSTFLKELAHPEVSGFLVIDAQQQSTIGEILFCEPEKVFFAYEELKEQLHEIERNKLEAPQLEQSTAHQTSEFDEFGTLLNKELMPIDILAWAELGSRIGWQVIIVADTNPNYRSQSAATLNSEAQFRPPFGFHVIAADDKKRLASIFGVISGTRKFGRSQIDSTDGKLIYGHDPASLTSRNWGYYDLPNTKIILDQWIREEFENDQAVNIFNQMCEQLSKSTSDSEKADSEQTQRVLLYVLSLARRLATRSFEGHECDTNLILTPLHNIEDLSGKDIFGAELYSFQEPQDNNSIKYQPCFFHAADGEFLEADIELAQSPRLCMVVDLEKGALHSILQLSKTESDSPILVFKEYTSEEARKKRYVLLRMCPYGYVEVYFNGIMNLWYDRSQWQSMPFESLAKRLWKYYENHEAGEGNHRLLIRRIISAIGEVMNRRESSIIAFISPDDLEGDNLPITPMREGKVHRYQVQNLKIQPSEISVQSLAAILHLDGAHIIQYDSVLRFSQEILVKDEQASPASHGPGTGRRRARSLAESIAYPGFVVKVSASGTLKIFDGTREPQKN